MEITNSTIFIKMLQKLRENPHFKIVELILCAFLHILLLEYDACGVGHAEQQ